MIRIFPTRRRVKRIALGVGILIGLLLMANGIMAWRVEARFQAMQAEIRAAGDPASIADLKPAPIPDDQNAAAHLEKMVGRLREFSRDYARFYDSELGTAYEKNRDQGQPVTAEQIAAIRKILDQYADLDVKIANAAACKQYASRADFSLRHQEFLEHHLDHVQEFRTVARYVLWRMRSLAHDGKRDDAANRGIELLTLARLYDHEPTMVAGLVSYGVCFIAITDLYDTLALGSVAPEVYRKLDATLAEFENPARMSQRMRGERAFMLSAVDDSVNGIPLAKFAAWHIRSLGLDSVQFANSVIDISQESPRELVRQLQPGETLAAPTSFGVLADLLEPALKAWVMADQRATALSRSMRIYNALRQYADEHGHEASGLQDLNLPPDATLDPFSEEPLKLKHMEDGWFIYSVGTDGDDDGGDLKESKDYGLAPAKYRP